MKKKFSIIEAKQRPSRARLIGFLIYLPARIFVGYINGLLKSSNISSSIRVLICLSLIAVFYLLVEFVIRYFEGYRKNLK